MLDEEFVWALGENNRVSCLKIWVNEGKKELIEYFKEKFDIHWNEALEYMEVYYGSCVEKNENYYPLSYEEREDCVYIGIGNLTLHYGYGDYYDGEQGSDAFDNALDDLVEHYPGLKYDGFIVYIASDVHGGVAGDYFISSEKKKDNARSRAIVGEFIKDLYDALDDILLEFTGHKIETSKINKIDVYDKYGVSAYDVWNDYVLERVYNYEDFIEKIKFHKSIERWINKDVLEHVYEALIESAHLAEKENEINDLEKKVAYAIEQVKNGKDVDTINNESAEKDNVIVFGLKNKSELERKEWEYSCLGKNRIRLTAYNGYDEHVVIPSEYEGKKVVSLDSNVFNPKDRPNGKALLAIKTVHFPGTIKEIPPNIFPAYDGFERNRFLLRGVIIEEGVVSIGESAFYLCNRLSYVVLPQGLRNIGRYAFSGCVSLKCLELPDELKTIGSGAFEACISLDKIDLPKTIKTIPGGAFEECEFEEFSIGDGVKSIEMGAFSGCKKLKKVIFNDSLKKIESKAFNYCPNLEMLENLPSGIRIESDSFLNCKKLEKDGAVIVDGKFVGFTSGEPKAVNLPTNIKCNKDAYEKPFVIYREDSRKELNKVRFSEYEPGDEVEFGQFPTDLTYKLSPIKWKMIAKEKDKALLITTYGLIGVQSKEDDYLGTWEKSEIRRFLNKDFYNIAFSLREKRQILKSNLENKGQKKLRRPDGNETKDKVFMLSLEEVKRYLKGVLEGIRKTEKTEYAKSKASLERARFSSWYTRTGGPWGCYLLAKIDCEDGEIDYAGNTYSNDVIRPAIWVKIDR